MPDVDLEMIESARLALKQERAENVRLHTELERLRGALTDLASWQPETEVGLAALHPQHRAAVEQARAALTPLPAEEDERG